MVLRFLQVGVLVCELAVVPLAVAQGTPRANPSSVRTDLTPRDAEELQRALALYEGGKFSAACPPLVQLAARYTSDARVQTAAGMCLLESDNLKDGVPYLQRAMTLHPADLAVTRNLGIALLRLGRPNEAVPLLEIVTQQAPTESSGWISLAQASRASGDSQRALQAYEHAFRLLASREPDELPNLLYDWAATLLAANRPQEALEILGRIPGSATDATVVELRAEVLEKLGQFAPALADFRRAAEQQPTEQNLLAYGEDLLRHWTFSAAAEIFNYGVKRYPESVRLQRDLGIAYYGDNDYVHASETFGALLLRQPESAVAADLLGRSCSALGTQSISACDQLKTFALAHPGNAAASLYSAIMLLQQPASSATYDQAGQLLVAAVKVDPALAAAWYQMGVLQQAKSDWAASSVSLEKAISLRPTYPEAHYRLSRAYAHMGKAEQARQQMDLQQVTAEAAKKEEARRLEGVLTFLTESH